MTAARGHGGPDRVDLRHVLCMTGSVYQQILCAIGRKPPEAGGLLLGPVDHGIVTHFHFDTSAACSGQTYTPDHVTLGRLMKSVWLPAGLDMKGFVHSHPPGLDRLSTGDLVYIRRLLIANPDMDLFLAPLVLPGSFRFCPFVVDRLGHSFVADLELI